MSLFLGGCPDPGTDNQGRGARLVRGLFVLFAVGKFVSFLFGLRRLRRVLRAGGRRRFARDEWNRLVDAALLLLLVDLALLLVQAKAALTMALAPTHRSQEGVPVSWRSTGASHIGRLIVAVVDRVDVEAVAGAADLRL
jgi:hypothetical protein